MRGLVACLLLAASAAAGDPPRFTPVRHVVPGLPGQIVAADLDRDGVEDLVATTESNFTFAPLVTLRGTGSGTFAESWNGTYSGNDNDLIVVDLDGDDLPDAVFGSDQVTPNGLLHVLHGPGDTTLQPVVDVQLPAFAPGLGFGDFDLDGDLDLMATQVDGAMRLVENVGPGQFDVGPPVGVDAGHVYRLRAGDFDADGVPDVLAWTSISSDLTLLSVLRGDGAGGLLPVQPEPSVPDSISTLELADVDADDDLDAVVAIGGQLLTWLNDGSGNLAPTAPSLPGYTAWDMTLGEIDGDGLPDLLAGNENGVVWARGAGEGLFDPPVLIAQYGIAVALSDCDLDGRLDAVYGQSTGTLGEVDIVRNLGGGQLSVPDVVLPDPALTALLLPDLDADSEPDLVVASTGPNRVTLRRGLGNGAFGPPQLLNVGGLLVSDLGVGDVDLDGVLDLQVDGPAAGSFATRIYHGLGNTQVVATPGFSAYCGDHAVLADLDGNGALDLAGAAIGNWWLRQGLGDGTFGPLVSEPSAGKGGHIAIGDIDGDEDLDVVVTTLVTPWLVVHRNDGGAVFSQLAPIVAPNDALEGLVLGDLDGDGAADACVAHSHSYYGSIDVSVWKATGGTLALADTAMTGSRNAGLRLADVDGDGELDVLTRPMGGGVALLLGDGACHVTSVHGIAGFDPAEDVAIDDIDGDGLADVYITSKLGLRAAHQLAPPTWCSVAGGKPGAHGVPVLKGLGTLQPATPVALRLLQALESAPVILVAGLDELSQPFKGGTLIPVPALLIGGLLTDPDGDLLLTGTWPAGVPSGVEIWFQAWITDSAATHGLAASTGLRALTP